MILTPELMGDLCFDVSLLLSENYVLKEGASGGCAGAGGTAIYGLYGYVPLRRVWFSSSLLWVRVRVINRSVWV